MKRMAVATSLLDPKPTDLDAVYVALADRLKELPPFIQEIALLFDGSRSPREVAAAAQISEAQCAGIIKKLTALGILRRRRPRRPTAPMGTFSPEEEAFFSADVAPIDECNEPFYSFGERMRAAVCEVIVRLQGQRSFL